MINEAYEVETGDCGVAFKTSVRIRPGFENVVEDPIKTGNVVKALREGVCVGCIIWAEKDDSLYFGPLAIKTGYQKQGIGKRLIQYMEELTRAKHKSKLDMVVVNHRTDVIPMYEKMGFVPTGETQPYYEPDQTTRESHFVFFSKPIIQ